MSDKLLLCTDLDRTLLPNGPQQESPQARLLLRNMVKQNLLEVAFVSGRDRWLVESALANYRLPTPAFVISDVGSSIYDCRGGRWLLLQAWHDVIAPDWAGHDHTSMHELLQSIPQLTLQEGSRQNRYKLSYYLPLDIEESTVRQQVDLILKSAGVKASLTYSVDEQAEVGLLDILPISASKLHAIHFLRDWLGMAASNILFSGDSGNDLPALQSDLPAVLVANASDQVRQQAIAQSQVNGYADRLFIANTEGVLGMNGNYAGGIVAGILHYHPSLKLTLDNMISY